MHLACREQARRLLASPDKKDTVVPDVEVSSIMQASWRMWMTGVQLTQVCPLCVVCCC